MNFCTKCGNKLSPGNNFCTQCGTQIRNNGNNNYQPQIIYVKDNNSSSSAKIFLYITIALSIIACFLPIVSVSILGYSISYNYVYNQGRTADGIIIVVFQLLSIILLACNTKIPVIIMQLLSCSIFGYFIFRLFTSFEETFVSSSSYFNANNIYNFLGVGFYLLLISLFLSFILSCLLPNRK